MESPTDSPGELRMESLKSVSGDNQPTDSSDKQPRMDYDELNNIEIVRSETAPESKYTDIRSKRFIGEDGVHYDWKYFIYKIDGVKIVTENMARFLSKSKNHADLVMALHESAKRSWLLTQLRGYAQMHKKGKFMKKLHKFVKDLPESLKSVSGADNQTEKKQKMLDEEGKMSKKCQREGSQDESTSRPRKRLKQKHEAGAEYD